MDWIHLSPDGIEWWVLVNMAMNLNFLKSRTFLHQLDYCQLLKKDSALNEIQLTGRQESSNELYKMY
jgi:hypothetical protein